jgi:hypothetical protein
MAPGFRLHGPQSFRHQAAVVALILATGAFAAACAQDEPAPKPAAPSAPPLVSIHKWPGNSQTIPRSARLYRSTKASPRLVKRNPCCKSGGANLITASISVNPFKKHSLQKTEKLNKEPS